MSPSSIEILVESIDQPSVNTIWGMPDYFWWIIIVICLFISALFSASENAFSNCNKYHFKVLADEGKITAKIIVKLVEKFDNTLITILVGNNIVQTFMSYLSAMIFYNICNANGLAGLEAIISTIVMAILVYVVSDTVPKIISKEIPNKLVYVLAYPVYIIGLLLSPISIFFKGILTAVHKLFKIKEDNILTKEDFILQADEAVVEDENEDDEEKEEEELFEPNELQLLNRAFYFDSIYVKEVLTPREKILAVDINGLTYEKLNKIILDTTFSRIPVYDGSIDNIIGILTVKNYFKEYTKDPHLEIRGVLSKPLFVDYSAKVDDIFRSFNKEKKHIAIVKKDGKVVGMITMEDVLEELVGEINEKKTNILKEASKK